MYEIRVKQGNEFIVHESAGTFARKDRALGAVVVLERIGEKRVMMVEQIPGSADQDEFPLTTHARPASSNVSPSSEHRLNLRNELAMVRSKKKVLPALKRTG